LQLDDFTSLAAAVSRNRAISLERVNLLMKEMGLIKGKQGIIFSQNETGLHAHVDFTGSNSSRTMGGKRTLWKVV
jgi:hypothetical protein